MKVTTVIVAVVVIIVVIMVKYVVINCKTICANFLSQASFCSTGFFRFHVKAVVMLHERWSQHFASCELNVSSKCLQNHANMLTLCV